MGILIINNKKYPYIMETSLCLDCLQEMEIETDIQLCGNCMDNYNMDLLWKRHDNNEIDALDFNESGKIRELYRIN